MRDRSFPRATSDADQTLTYEAGRPSPGALSPHRSRTLKRLALQIGKAVLILFLAYYVFSVVLLVAYRFVPPPTTGVQIQRQIEAWIGRQDYTARKTYRPITAMSRHVPRAVVAAEDGRFWSHFGFDLVEMRRAGEEAVGGGRVRGASTITQQLMKNLFGCACRNPIRKVYDLTLTPAAELILGKRRILELYLNEVEWGDGIFGVEAAARHYYGVSAKQLSRTQAAGLAALLPNPLRRTPANTAGYRAAILRRMQHRGW